MGRGIPTEEVLREMLPQQSPSAWRLVRVKVPKKDEPFEFSLCLDRLRKVRHREGRYLLRTNLVGRDPAEMWEFYTQLVQVEEAFKNLKGDLALRPIHHQKEKRIEAHIFVAFMAYTLHVPVYPARAGTPNPAETIETDLP